MQTKNKQKNFFAVTALAYNSEVRFSKRAGIEIPKKLGIKNFFIEPTKFGIYHLDWILGTIKSLSKLMRVSKNYYGIICFTPYFLPFLFLTRKPIVFVSTDYFEGETYQQKIKRIVYKLIKYFFIPKCIAVVGTTNYIKKSFEGLVPKNRLFLIRTGIEVKNFKPNRKVRLKLNRTPILYYHGQIRDDYNIQLLIKSLDYIKVPVELWLVGGGPAENKMKELAKKSKHKVVFFGVQPYRKILKLIKRADICLQPLPTLSMKLWEYFAAGKPVVGVDGEKIREVVNNYEHAILTRNEPKEYAKGIELLLKNKKLRKKLVKNGLNLIKLVDWKNLIPQYKKLLEKL